MKSPLYPFFFIFLTILSFISCSRQTSSFIDLRNSKLINETGYGNIMAWFDEQDTARIPKTQWETPGQKDFWPAGIVIDFGQIYKITGVWIFDGPKSFYNGSDFEHKGGTLEIKTGQPFDWENQISYALSNDSAWHFVSFETSSRFIQFLKVPGETFMWNNSGPFQSDLEIRELILCGYPENNKNHEKAILLPEIYQKGKDIALNTTSDSTQNNRNHRFSMDQFIGVNNFFWSPASYNSQIGFIREYHHWKQNGVNSVNDPVSWFSADKAINFDVFYKQNMDKVCPDIHRHVQEEIFGEARPDFGNDPTVPASYELISDFIFQYAARYGHTIVSDALLRVQQGEPSLTGAGWISYLETWNEPDRWWGKDGDHFTPYQLSAMASAVYDGHLRTMGLNHGGKNADPLMKMVLAGLTSLDTSYISAMKWWSDHNRNGSFPADVITFHHYCNTSGGQTFHANTKGISPEADDFKGQLQKLVEWRNRNLPGCEIWLSEFGWDSSADSPQAATGHTNFPEKISSSELQAIWLIRGYLAGAAAGIDRMCMFMLNDEEGSGLFKTCGLLTINNTPKTSWYYLSTFMQTLKETFFNKEILSGHPDVWIYQFSDKENTKDVYVLWCPTSDGTIVKNFMFSIPGFIRGTKIIQFGDLNPSGKISPLKLMHNMAVLEVSETPLMIVVEK